MSRPTRKRPRAGGWSRTTEDVAEKTGQSVMTANEVALEASLITGRPYTRASIGRLVARGRMPHPEGYAPLPVERDPHTGRALYSGVFARQSACDWLRSLRGDPDAITAELERRHGRPLILDIDVLTKLHHELGMRRTSQTLQRWTTKGQFVTPLTRVRHRTADGQVHAYAAYDRDQIDDWFAHQQAGPRAAALEVLRSRTSNDRNELAPLVRRCRDAGVLWREIADELNVSVQAVAARFKER